ncbi:MAG: hypothetical protein ABSC23_02025 [Bryobacteraceae bacterium]|jgi:hypothetical protein
MSRFLEDAVGIFDAATRAAGEDAPSDMAIMVDSSGGIRVVDAAGWHPETLRQHYGAPTVFQITRLAGAVRVTGRSGAQRCVLETTPAGVSLRPSAGAGVDLLRYGR